MIGRLISGKPFETEAVVNFPEYGIDFENEKMFPFGEISLKEGFKWEFQLLPDDIVYGLGENLGGINKRGKVYRSWCSDDPAHTEEKGSLYGAHNFIMIYSPKVQLSFGLFFDYPGEIIFDIGWTDSDLMTVTCAQADLKIFLITPDKEKSTLENYSELGDIVHQFRKMIGKSYVAPLWAMGYLQSRWGYGSEKDLENVYKNHKKLGIPLDGIFLDIDYMKDFRDFTVNPDNFKDLKKSVSKLKKNNVHVIPIIDAGIKAGDDDPVDVEGLEKDCFCKKADGSVFQGVVWPGMSHFPDFLQPEVRKWFGSKYKVLTDCGIDGFWNDMNEPAIFCSEDGVKMLNEELGKVMRGETKDKFVTWRMKDLVCGVQNSMKDYSSFYHEVDEKTAGNFAESVENGIAKVRHDKIHNLYGYNMTRAAAEALGTEESKALLISRASFIGLHRYSGIWTGDNYSWWSHILLLLRQLPSLNMCGFLYVGCDTGGFGCNTHRELLLRFLQLSIFTPLLRNHSALGTREQEVYKFGDIDAFKAVISMRYRLIPHLYSEYKRCASDYDMMFKPLSIDFPEDKIAVNIEDQLLLGNSMMIAPVYEPNARGRTVYLPEEMTLVRCRLGKGADKGEPDFEVLPAGLHFVEYDYDEVVFYIRKGKKICVVDSADSTEELDMNTMEYWG